MHDAAVPAKLASFHDPEGEFFGKIIGLSEGEDRALLGKLRDSANAAQRPVSKVDMSKVGNGLANLNAGRTGVSHRKILLIQDDLKPEP